MSVSRMVSAKHVPRADRIWLGLAWLGILIALLACGLTGPWDDCPSGNHVGELLADIGLTGGFLGLFIGTPRGLWKAHDRNERVVAGLAAAATLAALGLAVWATNTHVAFDCTGG